MPTLAPKLPWNHPFAGGYPRLGGQPLPTDPDAIDYLERVAAADGAAVEVGVAMAVDAFFRAVKATSGLFDAIKASCILCGARTLEGALVPLAGTAPTNNNFVAADYARGGATPGLIGDASTKYLDSNTAASVAPLNNAHIAVFASALPSVGVRSYIGVSSGNANRLGQDTNPDPNTWMISDTGSGVPRFTDSGTGFKGVSRSDSSEFLRRTGGASTAVTRTASTTPSGALTFGVFANGTSQLSDARIAFYSIGESLDLEALDDAVSALVTAIGAAV